MSRELERVRWRCRRGLLELDIILQRFVDRHYLQLGEVERQEFHALLELADNDLWQRIASGQSMPEARERQPVLSLLQACW